MNFEHTEDRRMLADTLNRFITEQYPFEVRNQVAGSEQGLSTSVWQQLAEIGALGALFPEAVGGFGGAGFDVSVVFESLGRGLVVEPFLGALIVGRALAAAGSPAQQVALAGLIDGSTVAALAHDEPGNHYELSRVATRATATATGWQLDGAKAVVLQAQAAQLLLVSARVSGDVEAEDGISLFLVPADAAGVHLRGYGRIDGGRAAELSLQGVQLGADALLGGAGRALPRWSWPSAGACWRCAPRPWAPWTWPSSTHSSTCRHASSSACRSAAFRPCNTAWPTCCWRSNKPARP